MYTFSCFRLNAQIFTLVAIGVRMRIESWFALNLELFSVNCATFAKTSKKISKQSRILIKGCMAEEISHLKHHRHLRRHLDNFARVQAELSEHTHRFRSRARRGGVIAVKIEILRMVLSSRLPWADAYRKIRPAYHTYVNSLICQRLKLSFYFNLFFTPTDKSRFCHTNRVSYYPTCFNKPPPQPKYTLLMSRRPRSELVWITRHEILHLGQVRSDLCIHDLSVSFRAGSVCVFQGGQVPVVYMIFVA